MIDTTLKNANILIVDDQQANIDILTGLLEVKGYTNCAFTTDPRTVLTLFSKFKPDLLLLDLNMPHLNGFQIMMQLNALIPADTYFPILVLTADITTESKQKALAGGANDFLTKPFDLIEVDLRIKNLLNTRFLHQQLENQNLILEEKVKERTVELEKTNVELMSAKNKAEEMNRLKSYFLENMSHELRTPLISVLGFAEILHEELTEPEQKELVYEIMKGGKRLNETLTGVLEFAKLEAEKVSLTLSPVNLAKEIEKAIKPYVKMAAAKYLFLRTEIGEEFIKSNIDAELFNKALNQLIHNAIKFTKKGGIFIALNQVKKDEIDWAVIQVIDTGIGIAKKDYETIFMDFRQSSEGLCRSHEGSGLGLSIAKKMIELMNGKIEVESEVEKGSTFSIWFPAVMDLEAICTKINEKRNTIIEELTVRKTGALKKILVVEDNQSNRNLLKKMLEKEYEVSEVEDGFSGIALASKKIFDIILMDINLGTGIDGIDTLHEIRKYPAYFMVPIIALTAYAMTGDEERILREGFDGYLKKPFSKGDLLQEIRRLTE